MTKHRVAGVTVVIESTDNMGPLFPTTRVRVETDDGGSVAIWVGKDGGDGVFINTIDCLMDAEDMGLRGTGAMKHLESVAFAGSDVVASLAIASIHRRLNKK